MAKTTIMIVDDEEGIRTALSGIFEDEGFEVLAASSGEEAVRLAKEFNPEIVVLDVWLSGMDGMQTMKELLEFNPSVPVIIISGHANIELAVKATRIGAYDILEKPLSMEKVLLTVQRALEKKSLELENRALKQDLLKRYRLVGTSSKMQFLGEQIKMAAVSNSRVLILGESGAGKELVARLLHENSPRATRPFVEVNCAAIPQELIESELFGHEKGSFTGAFETKKGKFEQADNGTLFLDEIGDMSLQTQAKVLRVIETQEFQRVGGNKNIKVDTRIISATNKDLSEEVKKNNFREDLYFRLNVIPLQVPALRERLDDIPALVDYFLELFSAEYRQQPKKVAPEAVKLLQRHSWPGNIRELKNTLERLVIMTPSRTISAADLSIPSSARQDYFSCNLLKEARDMFEKDFIIKKLEENGWNISKTAEILDIERSNLHRKIKAYDIDVP
ncbi:MAG: sigma-54-dependent Fis family transcriptional regulator [Nitrospirae bacterium]|nr:MAG: sigma-54-dependent Fis family transcriptional regulator [Nitrospirota bacterium]